ncbi:hypothetical protein [Azospirillum doebereinerae]
MLPRLARVLRSGAALGIDRGGDVGSQRDLRSLGTRIRTGNGTGPAQSQHPLPTGVPCARPIPPRPNHPQRAGRRTLRRRNKRDDPGVTFRRGAEGGGVRIIDGRVPRQRHAA